MMNQAHHNKHSGNWCYGWEAMLLIVSSSSPRHSRKEGRRGCSGRSLARLQLPSIKATKIVPELFPADVDDVQEGTRVGQALDII